MAWVTIGVSAGTALLGGRQASKQRKRQEQLEATETAYETDRQTKIDATSGAINREFDSPKRQAQYNDYSAAMRENLGTELVRQKRDAARNLKFALAKAGQVGGSQAVDKNAQLGDEFQRGALQNERGVLGSVADLRGQDELARNSLLTMARSGLDMGSAVRRSQSSLEQNLGAANLDSLQTGLGDVFKDTGAAYKAINERVAQRRGFGYKTNRKELYG